MTNISLVRLLWVMVNGSFLSSRGAIHSALAMNGFSDEEIRHGWAALRYGSWSICAFIASWQEHVAVTNSLRSLRIGQYQVKSVDIARFFRLQIQGKVNHHYAGLDQRALSTWVFEVYKKPRILATDLLLSRLPDKERWSVEHPTLAAKQMMGLHRQFVFTAEFYFRLPELALLASDVLAHCPTILPPDPNQCLGSGTPGNTWTAAALAEPCHFAQSP